ncbi:MAG TPA: hypothetical protein VEH81_11240 [Ktedonobacteraceae bacterium]|nr:hypothetical protein [Ktedonobacteraceae bacterium]
MLPSGQSVEARTRLHGIRLVLLWIGWVLLAAYTLGVFFGSLPFYFTHLQTICKHTPCVTGQPIASTLIQLHHLGLTLATYALFVIMLNIIAACIAFMIAAVLAWRKPDDWLALLAALALVMLITANSTYTLEQLSSPWQVPTSLSNILTWSLLLLVFCLIPNGRFVPRWTRWLPVFWIICNLLFIFFSQLQSNRFLVNIIWFSVLACLVVSLVYRYRVVSTPVERQQTKWIVFGGSVNIVLAIIWGLPPFLFPSFARPGTLYDLAITALNIFLLLPFILCVAIAILRYRLWDIDILINRTLVYGSLTLILALIYFASVFALQSLVSIFTGHYSPEAQTPVVIVVSTLAIAALFTPLRRRLQALIDRRFYRSKYDAARTIAEFSITLSNEVDLNQLRKDLIAVVQETMQPSHVSLWLRDPDASIGHKTRLLSKIDEE